MKTISAIVCGIDEVGRGALAGPLVAAGVILTSQAKRQLLSSGAPIRDSKKLTAKQRERIFSFLCTLPTTIAVVSVSASEIDSHGVGKANTLAFRTIIHRLSADEYILDGNLKIENIHKHITSIIRADETIIEVSLASIVAKVLRDRYMNTLHQTNQRFGWNMNKGYGTLMHRRNIRDVGPTPHHRRSFLTNILSGRL